VLKLLARFRPFWPAWVALAAGLALTALATVATHSVVASLNRQGLATIGAEIAQKIQLRLQAHALVLRDAAAFLRVSGEIDRAHWRDYVVQAQVHQNLPGVQGLGFALLIPADRLSEHARTVRDEGFPDYRVWPQGERPVYTSIVFLEPFAGRNLRAFGYDMFSEPVRRAAMERARDQDLAALSDKVRLVQETETDIQAGTLMYVPVYRAGAPTDTLEQRRAALIGWVYSPFRMNDLMHGILGGWDQEGGKRVRLAIYDADPFSPATLLYDSQAADQQRPAAASANALRIPIDFNGQHWTLNFSQDGRWGHSPNDVLVWLVAGSGTSISVLLAALVSAYARARAQALRLAAELTARQSAERALGEREAEYRLLADNTTDVLWHLNQDTGKWLYVSPSVERQRGFSVAQVMEQRVEDVMTAQSWDALQPRVAERTRRFRGGEPGAHAYRDEIEQLRRDGSTVWTEVNSRYLWNADGEVTVLGVTRDISERRAAEGMLREAERRYRDLFESSPVGLYRSTPQGRYLDVNAAFARILGYDSAQALIADVSDIATQLYAHPREREVLAGLLAERGQVAGFEIEAKRRDGLPVWISADVNAVRDTDGIIVVYQGAMTDITERVRGTLARDTVSAVARLAVLSDSADGFRQALPALLSTRLGYPMVAVETYDAVRGDMTFAGAVGIPAAADGRLRVPIGETLSGQVATSGEALVETAADARPEYAFAALRTLGVVTFVCAPMTIRSRVLGTLALADTRRRPDAAWAVELLRTVADTAADAIERLETQAALRDSERNYRGLMDNLHAGVVVHAPDTRIRFANPMASQLLGLGAQQLRGIAAVDPAWRFIREDGTAMPPAEFPVERVAASGAPLQNLILGILGSGRDAPTWVQCEAHPIRDDQGQLQQIVVTFFDITERQRAVDSLKKSEALLNEMGRMARIGGWQLDLATGKQVWTEAVYLVHELDTTFEPNLDNAIGFYPPSAAPIVMQAVERAVNLGEPFDLEVEFVTAKGNRRWIHTIGRAEREHERIVALTGVFQDITARKVAEDELASYRDRLEALVETRTQALNEQLARVREQEHLLIHQARLAAMGEMLGNIAHQWRQPLSALALMLGNLQDAERHQELTPQYLAQKIADAHRLIDKMSTTISDFRDFFRPDKPSETFDLSQPVRAALALMGP